MKEEQFYEVTTATENIFDEWWRAVLEELLRQIARGELEL